MSPQIQGIRLARLGRFKNPFLFLNCPVRRGLGPEERALLTVIMALSWA